MGPHYLSFKLLITTKFCWKRKRNPLNQYEPNYYHTENRVHRRGERDLNGFFFIIFHYCVIIHSNIADYRLNTEDKNNWWTNKILITVYIDRMTNTSRQLTSAFPCLTEYRISLLFFRFYELYCVKISLALLTRQKIEFENI